MFTFEREYKECIESELYATKQTKKKHTHEVKLTRNNNSWQGRKTDQGVTLNNDQAHDVQFFQTSFIFNNILFQHVFKSNHLKQL